ncbi:MAG: HEAT repeat domain-containing protein [Polyangiaceae bacterium]
MVSRTTLSTLVLAALLVHRGAAAEGPPDKPGKGGGKGGANVVAVSSELGQKLKSEDPAEIRGALDEVRVAGRSASHLAGDVAALLDRGVSRALTEAALETLGDLEVESVATSIVPYTMHRDVKIRRLAVSTLVRCKGPVAVRTLRQRLADSDAMVRGTAASGLGAMKAKDALPDLFVAFDHKVAEAAASIGQLCTPKECDDFGARLGRQPFEVMTGGFDQILFRPTSEVSDDGKIKVIGRLRELGTADSNKFLRDVQKRLPKTASARVKQALEQAIQATGGGA